MVVWNSPHRIYTYKFLILFTGKIKRLYADNRVIQSQTNRGSKDH